MRVTRSTWYVRVRVRVMAMVMVRGVITTTCLNIYPIVSILKSLSNVYWIVGGLKKKGDKFLLSKNDCKTFKVYIFGVNKKNFINRVLTKLFGSTKRLSPNPFITKRKVEAELINNLYEIDSKGLHKMKGLFLGNGGRHSENFQLFDNDSFAIKTVAEGLINIMKQVVKSEIYIGDSFFNIVDAGGGISPHRHIRNFDKVHGLINQKYSLTYYLSVGDHEPGIFKLHNPDEEFLPFEGMVMIFPAARMHSAVYAGKTGRIMIGVNFYSII